LKWLLILRIHAIYADDDDDDDDEAIFIIAPRGNDTNA